MERARKRLGQHFLAAPGVVRRIVDLAQVGEGDRVLEIGPGRGALTEVLLARGARVTAIELDRDLAPVVAERFDAQVRSGQLVVWQEDADKVDWPRRLQGGGWACVANLPYNVGTRITTGMLRHPGSFDRLVLMLQQEVAARLVAPAGDRKRGSLSVYAQARAQCRRGFGVAPGAFRPPPKVDSAVVRLDLYDLPRMGGVDPDHFEALTRAGFAQPRKTVRNNLGAAFGREAVDTALRVADVAPGRRPATLELDEWVALARVLG